MNYKNYFLILFVSLTVLSCKNDDDDAPASFLLTQENLAGNYDHTYFASTKVVNGFFQGAPVTLTTTVGADTYEGTLEISANGTFDTSGTFRKIITEELAGGVPNTTETTRVLGEDGTYSLDANTQSIDFDGFNPINFDNGTYVFSLFNENEIRLTQEYTVEVGDETTDYMVEIRFVRQ